MNELEPQARVGNVRLPAEVVRENIATVLRQQPDLVSYDPTTDEGEMLSYRLAVDPGVPAQLRDGWRGTVVHWGISAQEVPDREKGTSDTVPSLALLTEEGQLCRLFGWPAISSWAQLLKAIGKERCQLGIKVRIKRQPSNTAGRSYWIVLPDA